MKGLFTKDKKMLEKIKKLTDADMKTIATKLADDYCEQLYWDSLKIIVEDYKSSSPMRLTPKYNK